nr:uncharacterized protein LOC106677047 [Halyomorpha halys]
MVENKPVLAISTLLDPRCTSGKLISLITLKEILNCSLSPKCAHSSESDHSEGRSSSLFSEHAKIVQEMWKLRSSRATSELPDELAMYLKSPTEADMTKCPLMFWCNSGLYQKLAKVAKKYLFWDMHFGIFRKDFFQCRIPPLNKRTILFLINRH